MRDGHLKSVGCYSCTQIHKFNLVSLPLPLTVELVVVIIRWHTDHSFFLFRLLYLLGVIIILRYLKIWYVLSSFFYYYYSSLFYIPYIKHKQAFKFICYRIVLIRSNKLRRKNHNNHTMVIRGFILLFWIFKTITTG